MKKLNITKEHFENSRYFTKKYGNLEYVSESGKTYKTSKGKLLKFLESLPRMLSQRELVSMYENNDYINEFTSAQFFILVAENNDKDTLLFVQRHRLTISIDLLKRDESGARAVYEKLFIDRGDAEPFIYQLCERHKVHILKSKWILDDEYMPVNEANDQDIDLAFKNGVHSCAEEINNGIKKILEYYTMPSYNYQSEAFKTAFEEIIPFKHNIEAILKLTES